MSQLDEADCYSQNSYYNLNTNELTSRDVVDGNLLRNYIGVPFMVISLMYTSRSWSSQSTKTGSVAIVTAETDETNVNEIFTVDSDLHIVDYFNRSRRVYFSSNSTASTSSSRMYITDSASDSYNRTWSYDGTRMTIIGTVGSCDLATGSSSTGTQIAYRDMYYYDCRRSWYVKPLEQDLVSLSLMRGTYAYNTEIPHYRLDTIDLSRAEGLSDVSINYNTLETTVKGLPSYCNVIYHRDSVYGCYVCNIGDVSQAISDNMPHTVYFNDRYITATSTGLYYSFNGRLWYIVEYGYNEPFSWINVIDKVLFVKWTNTPGKYSTTSDGTNWECIIDSSLVNYNQIIDDGQGNRLAIPLAGLDEIYPILSSTSITTGQWINATYDIPTTSTTTTWTTYATPLAAVEKVFIEHRSDMSIAALVYMYEDSVYVNFNNYSTTYSYTALSQYVNNLDSLQGVIYGISSSISSVYFILYGLLDTYFITTATRSPDNDIGGSYDFIVTAFYVDQINSILYLGHGGNILTYVNWPSTKTTIFESAISTGLSSISFMDFSNSSKWFVSGGNSLKYSVDEGITWISYDIPEFVNDSANVYSVTENSSETVVLFDDGTVWTTKITHEEVPANVTKLISHNGVAYAVSNDYIYRSIDGNTWTIVTTSEKYTKVDSVNEYLVMFDNDSANETRKNYIKYSSDGYVWKSFRVDILETVKTISYINSVGYFVGGIPKDSVNNIVYGDLADRSTTFNIGSETYMTTSIISSHASDIGLLTVINESVDSFSYNILTYYAGTTKYTYISGSPNGCVSVYNDMFIASTDSGVIYGYPSSSSCSWSSTSTSSSFNDTSTVGGTQTSISNNYVISVGNSGAIHREYTKNVNTMISVTTTANLNVVEYVNETFVILGDGVILISTSTGYNTYSEKEYNVIIYGIFVDVSYVGDDYILLSDNGNIYKYSDILELNTT